MPWREEARSHLPPPSEGEPPHLREAILDELEDHLECAMQRELRDTDDPAVAKRRVLDRFGDPSRLARKLWFDAMKEQLMSQRILVATNIVTATAVLLVGIGLLLLWNQQKTIQTSLLAEINNLSRTTAAHQSMNWPTTELTIRNADGSAPDPDDVTVILTGHIFSDADRGRAEFAPDERGVVTVGPARPGRHSAFVSSADGFGTRLPITLRPGQVGTVNVELPDVATGSVQFKADWPDGLADDTIVVLRFNGSRGHADRQWAVEPFAVAVRSDGRQGLLSEPDIERIQSPDYSVNLMSTMSDIDLSRVTWQESVDVKAAQYSVIGLAIYESTETGDVDSRTHTRTRNLRNHDRALQKFDIDEPVVEAGELTTASFDLSPPVESEDSGGPRRRDVPRPPRRRDADGG